MPLRAHEQKTHRLTYGPRKQLWNIVEGSKGTYILPDNRRNPQSTSRNPRVTSNQLAMDESGQVSHFQPAPHQKPEQLPLLQRILGRFFKAKPEEQPSTNTTEIGSAGAAAPSVFQMSLVAQRYERRFIIQDVNLLVRDEPRARKATKQFADEAVREGFKVTITKAPNKQAAQDIADKVYAIVHKKLRSWAWMLIVEGDLFLQHVLKDMELTNVKRMPAASMERNTDDADEFVDEMEAFSQVDTITNDTVANFPLWMIQHHRWDHVDGERYGTSEIIASRRLGRLLELEEEAMAVHRMTRASAARHWKIGTEERPGNDTQIKTFRDENGFIEGSREVFNPMEIARDYFSNGLVEVEELNADSNVTQIADVEYKQNVFTAAGLPTPPSLYGLDAKSVNRDVMEDLREEHLKKVQILTDILKEIIQNCIELALLLKGTMPELVTMSIVGEGVGIEDAGDVVDRTIKLREVVMGDTPMPLITRKTAVQQIAKYYDIEDIDQEIEDLDAEQEEADQRQFALQQLQVEMEAAAYGYQGRAKESARQNSAVAQQGGPTQQNDPDVFSGTVPGGPSKDSLSSDTFDLEEGFITYYNYKYFRDDYNLATLFPDVAHNGSNPTTISTL